MGVLGVRVRVADPDHDVLVVLSEADGDLSLPIVIESPRRRRDRDCAGRGRDAPPWSPRPAARRPTRSASSWSGSRSPSCAKGTFIAELVLSNGDHVDARASDAIAIALRAAVDVWCAEDVLAQAAIVLDPEAPRGRRRRPRGARRDQRRDAAGRKPPSRSSANSSTRRPQRLRRTRGRPAARLTLHLRSRVRHAVRDTPMAG